MGKLSGFVFAVGLAITSAAFPAMAQQGQMPMGGMMGQGGGMMGGQGGMMGQGMQGGGMMGPGMGMGMGGCPMMGGMMGMGSSMQGMGYGMQGMMGQGCPWCGPGMMGSGYATPQPSVNLTVNDVKAYLDRWVAGNPNIQVANVVEQDANTITADIVTKDKAGLVQRYTFDKRTGFYRPVQ